MSYVNAGPIVLSDTEYEDSPLGAVTNADLDDLVVEFDVEFDTAWASGYVYLGDITGPSPGSDNLILRMRPTGTVLDVFLTETDDYTGTVVFEPANTSPQPLALNTVGTIRITHNAARLYSVYLNDVLIDSGTHPNVLDTTDGRFHLGYGGAGNMTVTNIDVSSSVVANNAPTLDTPQTDISVVETTSGAIADISGNFSDADLDTLTYSVSPALPTGMALNTTTGVISGNGSITVTAAADYTFTADDGNGGTVDDVVSITITATPAGLTIDSTDASMQRSTSFDVTFSNPAATPTTGNTSLASGNDTLTCTSVTGSDPYTATFTVGDLSKQVDGTGYVWTLTVDAETDDTSAIPLTIQAGWSKTDLVDPVFTLTSALRDYTGDAAVTSDALEVGPITGLGAGMSISFLPDGRYNINDPDGTWVDDIAFPRRVIQADGTIGITQVMTIEANSVATGIPTITGTAREGSTLTAVTTGIADLDGIASFSYQWYRGVAVISGATNPTYTIANGDIGSAIHVDVSLVDNNGTSEGPLSSANTAIVEALDIEAPVITLTGDATVNLVVGQAYTEDGATWTDNIDGSGAATVGGDTVDVNTAATYTVTYNHADAAGNAATQVTRTVVVADVTAPTITMLGSTPVTHDVFSAYVDTGATASDSHDGDITDDIAVVSTVNTNVTGPYTVRYNVADAAGNNATEVVRNVNVVDAVPPVITILGQQTIDHPVGVPYNDAGATALDAYDGDVTGSISANNTVNRNIVGAYQVFYDVSDSNGNAATQAVRTVNIVASLDTTPPVITLFGQNPVYITNGDVYNDAGARADDDTDGVITNNITTVNPVNTGIDGTYTVRYNVSDAAGNAATEVTRTVIVGANPDTTIPVITLSGPLTTYVNYGSSYVEPGYSASDDVDGVITSNVVVTNPVNTSIIGAYTVRYNVQDSAGNDASERTRTVIVQSIGDVEAPVITLIGGSEVEIPLGQAYVDAGATAADNLDGDISANIIVSNSVNVNQVGSYSVVYNVVDSNGNYATPVIRTVIVISDTAPRITINGPKVFYVDQNAAFADAGADVTSYIDGNSTIYASETVDTAVLGNTVLTYNYTDGDGDSADTQYRTVVVRDPNQAVVYIDAGSSILQPIITSIKG